ncbi:hypothetical protein HWV62_7048 [Athelia sp. TMB]|nr:hypothetical protein HWV62_7048 [Athelia sp. TMB]
MAARRPPPTRTRVNNVSNNAPTGLQQSRPSSVMTRPSSSMARSLTSTTDDAPQPPASTQSKLSKQEAETNIKVVIRCRRRSDREVQDKEPLIVSSKGPKSQDVTIETSVPISSLGVITLAPTRTYPFDLVFGPEADQAMIYNDVVRPMLDEVVQGYNCTLFAYGQTGTGKTYTMAGDLTPTPMGNPSAQAGMIPRVLFWLFHQLEKNASDYSVKVSYVELYNEELRDLLGSEMATPAGSAQPMSKGSNAPSSDGGLKIFDDASKKGVFIQNLEETLVKNSADALALLTKGSHRRQIAATKFNDHSSRSHSVFSITVHIKETSNMGDDLLKIGKLNLVDLAGSENIGRSGAENKRAREAGMINQSLLTLGRVINALVDRASHVPYRESKLTRLLQDSLGGRTKTCIIATVSPARCNMEETLSTLDYAMRAKSIRNKPELNQRMTRNALLKEYVVEIERLKADVLAAREKNGIFFSEETWTQLNTEHELRRTEMEEAKKQVEIVESQMRNLREEFEQSIALLMMRDGELKETKQKLKGTEEELGVKDGQLKVVKTALEEEVILRQAYQSNEGTMHGVAEGLKKVAGQSINDVGGLFDKLDRKNMALKLNTNAVSTHGKDISADARALSSKLEELIKISSQSTSKLRDEAKKYETKELGALASQSECIDAQLQNVQDAMRIIQTQDASSDSAIAAMDAAVKDAQEFFKNGFLTWSQTLQQSCEGILHNIQASSVRCYDTAEDALAALGSLVEALVQEARTFINSERESILSAKLLATNATTAEITHLREQNELLTRLLRSENAKAEKAKDELIQRQNELLTRLLRSENAKAEKAKDELIQRVSGLLGDFTAARDESLRAAVSQVADRNLEAEADMAKFESEHGEIMNSLVSGGKASQVVFDRKGKEAKRTRDGALKHVVVAKTALREDMANLEGSISTSMTTHLTQTQERSQALSETYSSAFDLHGRAKRARMEATAAMITEVQGDYRHTKQNIASTSKSTRDFFGRISSEAARLSTATTTYQNGANSDISSIEKSTLALVEEGTREDQATGQTPIKRAWQYVDQWELTGSRDTVLKKWRQQGVSNVGSETFVAEHLPLPEDDDENENIPPPIIFSDANLSEEPDEVVPESPIAVSLESSASSTSIPFPLPIVKRNANGLKGIPTIGTLTERPANLVTTRRSSRRVR